MSTEKTPAGIVMEAAEEYRRAEGTGPRWEGVASAWSAWDDMAPAELPGMLRWLAGARSEGTADRGPGVAFVALVIGCAEGEPIRRPGPDRPR